MRVTKIPPQPMPSNVINTLKLACQQIQAILQAGKHLDERYTIMAAAGIATVWDRDCATS
ncbi:hypothetical protein A9Q94_00995 [Rhodobacterales bacterium 56_14_T64]|nr:hypothetical protein A9Q94_00995 [Rhodobacterales bacterium 56_14_T64]